MIRHRGDGALRSYHGAQRRIRRTKRPPLVGRPRLVNLTV
jgi:hypothetical protein